MADIFLSYARDDLARVTPLAKALAAHGLTVWWDQHMRSGDEFSAEIERELNDAGAVVVCWSQTSVKSRWVRDEATIAARQGKLKAISLDGAEPPLGYMQYHAQDISAWSGAPDTDVIASLVAACVSDEPANAQKLVVETPMAAAIRERHANPDVSLIVLPFATISTDPADEVLAVAIHEDLTTQLARVRGYFVISRTSANVCAAKKMSPDQLHAELGVAYVLEGSLRRAGDNVRITAQLIDARSGGHIAALRFDKPYTALLDLQNDLIAQIVNHLGSEINLAEVRRLEARATANPTAMDLLKKAQSLMAQKGWNNATLAEAVGLLEQALEIDDEFAPAISQLALFKGVAAQFGLTTTPHSVIRDEVVALAERAVSFEGHASDVLGYAGCALCDVGEVELGFELLDRAFEIDPSNAQAVAAFGWAHLMLDRPQDAIEYMQAAIRISPQQPGLALWMYGLAQAKAALGSFDEARETLRRVNQFDPKFRPAYGALAALRLQDGDRAGAERVIARAKASNPDLTDADILAMTHKSYKPVLIDSGLVAGAV